jgi:hypothetical protein
VGGLVVLERSRRSPGLDWPPEFGAPSTRSYGETVLYLASLDDRLDPEGSAP